MNTQELRTKLLAEAKDMLYESWRHAVHLEQDAARAEKRAPKQVAPPDVKDVLALAEKMYSFVCKK